MIKRLVYKALIVVLSLTSCAERDTVQIKNYSSYPDSFGEAIIDSVIANAAPDLDLGGWFFYMHPSIKETDRFCIPTLGGCVKPNRMEIHVTFDPNQEAPWTHPRPEGWMVDMTCHELGHVYLRQTEGDSGMRRDADGVKYHETEGVFGEWFRWPREKCAPVVDEFGGYGEPLEGPRTYDEL